MRRFHPVGAYGLSFTVALITLILGIWIFGSLLEDLLAFNGTALLDAPVANFIALHRLEWLTKAFKAISFLGSDGVAIVVALSLAISLGYRTKNWSTLVFLFVVTAGAQVLDMAVGVLVGRSGPPAAWIAVPATHGFELGETAVFVLYAVTAHIVAASQSRWQIKVLIWSGAILVVFVTGISHIYLGTDWLTDVVSRWALALLWFSAAIIVLEIIEQSSGVAAPLPDVKPIHHVDISESAPEPLFVQQDIQRPEVSIDGLTQIEASERRSRGETNFVKEQSSRSVRAILKANIFTRFNALLGGLFVTILLVGGRQDALFGLILIANTAVGIIQELRAKRALDHLRLLIAPKAHIVRDAVVQDVPVDKIVIDDVLELRSGDQVPIDGILLAAQNLEVNESLLTGEADPIPKLRGDQVLSGSFIVAGGGRLQAVRVGEASYARRLARAAQQFALSQSQLRNGINNILRYITWALIPTALLLFITQLLYSPTGVRDAVVGSIAGVVGMVPEGLVLLTSTVMAIAVVRLARYGALVQELAAVELLARVDVLCADKTGTLTEGGTTLEEIVPASATDKDACAPLPADVRKVLGAFANDEASSTASLTALRGSCARPSGPEWNVVASVPFSSTRKWSALSFAMGGTWILGAPEMVLKNLDQAAQLLASVDKFAKKGKRVLSLAYSKQPLDAVSGTAALPLALEPAALVVLSEKIRTDVAETIRYFQEQGVAVKVISGDHVETVQAVAALAGVRSEKAAFDARNLPADPSALMEIVDQHRLFGRVTPAQKRLMVRALQRHGHVVAMIGDGINDVLAIKEADFGIALGSGTAASRTVAQLILLKDNFSALPAVIAEGRRVIANVERTSNLFITKTVYVFALAIAIGVAQAPFPFLPRHLSLVGLLTIGTPGFFLTLARNTTKARPGFVGRVLRFALTAGAMAAAATLLGYAAARMLVPNEISIARSTATLVLIGFGLQVLFLLARPQGIWQWLFLSALPILLFLVMAIPWLRDFFALQLPPLSVSAAIILIEAVSAATLLATNLPGSHRVVQV